MLCCSFRLFIVFCLEISLYKDTQKARVQGLSKLKICRTWTAGLPLAVLVWFDSLSPGEFSLGRFLLAFLHVVAAGMLGGQMRQKILYASGINCMTCRSPFSKLTLNQLSLFFFPLCQSGLRNTWNLCLLTFRPPTLHLKHSDLSATWNKHSICIPVLIDFAETVSGPGCLPISSLFSRVSSMNHHIAHRSQRSHPNLLFIPSVQPFANNYQGINHLLLIPCNYYGPGEWFWLEVLIVRNSV